MRCFSVHLKESFPFLGENGCDAVLEVLLPANLTEMNRQQQRRPCLLICPGGGYGMVSQREAEPIALNYLKEGYNVFLLWYSVAPNRFPQALREAACAVELIHRNAGEWNCDEEHVAIMGFSAGGHLAAHYSNAYAWPEVRQVLPDSKPVQASILCYPVITADARNRHLGSFQNLLGTKLPSPEEEARFSCQNMVTGDTPPTFLWHTAEDTCVPVQNSILYASALAEHKIPFELHIFPFGHHGLATCDRETTYGVPSKDIRHTQTWLEESCRWLRLIWDREK